MKKIALLSFLSVLLFSSCDEPVAVKDTDSIQENQIADSKTPTDVKWNSPIDSLNLILKQNPNNAEAYLSRAEKFLAIKSYQAAAADIYNAMQLDSNSAQARNLKGQLNFLQNKSRQAKIEWETCIKIDEQNVDCRLRLAELFIAVEDYEKALELVNEVITIDNNNYGGYYFKGLVVRDFYKDTTLALQYFQKAVDLNPNFISGLDMMGVMLAAVGDTLAEFYYKRIIDIDPNRDDVYYKLGVFYMNNDDINEALESYSKCLQINPKNAEAYYSIGFMHIQLKQYSEARGYFTKAIQNKEQNYRAYYGRGYCFELLGDIMNARNDYRAAIEANPVYTPAQEALGRVNQAIRAAESEQ